MSPPSSGSKNKQSWLSNQHQLALLVNFFIVVSCLAYSSTPKMVTKCSSETWVDFQRATRRYIPEDRWRPVSLSWCQAPSESHDQIVVVERTVPVLPLLGVLSDKKTGLSLVGCHSQLQCILRSSLSEVYVTNFASVHIVTCGPAPGQQFGKHIPAQKYRGTIGRPLLGNRAINTHTNCWETVFSVGSASRLYRGYRTESNESQNQNEDGASPWQSGKKGSAEDWLLLRVIVQEGVNKSSHSIPNPLLLVTEP
jgi:hypothetical protein